MDVSEEAKEVDILTKETILSFNAPPDGGYGWVVVIAAFFIAVIVGGNCFAFGVFYPVYIDEFQSTQGSVAWIGSISACLVVGPGPLTGAIADRYNNRYVIILGAVLVGLGFFLASLSTELWQLYFTQGLLAGIGYSLSFISGVSVVSQWFTSNRGVAVGIMVAGSGIGQLIFSLMVNALIDHGGWRFTLRILAAINAVSLFLCSLFIVRWLPCTKKLTMMAGDSSLFKDRNFCLLFAGTFINSLGTYMPYTHLPLYATMHGISKSQAVLILSLMGVANASGRIVVGWMADRFGKVLMFQLCMLFGGASTLCWMACTTFPTVLIYGLIFGFFAGGIISLIPSVSIELFGSQNPGYVSGLLYSSTAIGNLVSAPIGGFLHDAYHSYYPPIIAAGSFLLAGLLFVIFIDTHGYHCEEVGATASGITNSPSVRTDGSGSSRMESSRADSSYVKVTIHDSTSSSAEDSNSHSTVDHSHYDIEMTSVDHIQEYI